MNFQKEVYSFASYSLFRKLSDKMSVQDVILNFVHVIFSEKKTEYSNGFYVHQIKDDLFKEFGFSIPHSVVNQCLKKSALVTKKSSLYYFNNLNDDCIDNKDLQIIKETISDEIDENQAFINSIIEFIRKETGDYSSKIEEEVTECLFSYILENGLNQNYQKSLYYKYISSYLIGPHSEIFSKQITSIKEGAILLAGLSFNDSVSRQKKWVQKFDLYIEMEILFYLAGFNGAIYQQIATDTLELVKEINKNRKVIHLKCFDNIETQIDRYFETAISIFKSQRISEAKDAMEEIIKGSESIEDIRDKQFNFYKLIESYSIEFVETPSIVDDIEYNMSSIERISKYNIDEPAELDKITFINRIRGGELFSNLVKAKAMILTEKNQLARASFGIVNEEAAKIKKDNVLTTEIDLYECVPYHTSMWFLSARLWYDLNKGFGNSLPKSLDVISKAKIVVSNSLLDKLGKEYDDTIFQYNDGKISEESAIEKIAFLKSKMLKPDEIKSDNIEEITELLQMDKIDKKIQEHYHTKELNQELKKKLELETESKENEIEKYNILFSEKKDLENEKERIEKENAKLRQIKDNRNKKMARNSKIFFYFTVLGIPVLLLFWAYRSDKVFIIDILEKLFNIIALFLASALGLSVKLVGEFIEKKVYKYLSDRKD